MCILEWYSLQNVNQWTKFEQYSGEAALSMQYI